MPIVIEAPMNCDACIFVEHVEGMGRTCRFQPRYKKKGMPLFLPSNKRPDFCKIKKIVVYEEED